MVKDHAIGKKLCCKFYEFCKHLFALSACSSLKLIHESLLERLASHPLASHPAINSVRDLQPMVLRLPFYAGTFSC